METIFIGKNCIEVEKTDSTNSYLARLMISHPTSFDKEQGVFEGTVVLTNNQEQGRGQRGATWESEPNKNLTLSILLHPIFLRPNEQFQLNKAVSLGVADFVSSILSLSTSVNADSYRKGEERVRIKWPNDIYIGDKKVAGILIENFVSGDKLQQSIIGIGLNVNQVKFSAKLPNPTSLKIVAEKEFDLGECLAQLCSWVEKRYLELRTNHLSRIDNDYLQNLYRIGEWANYNCKGEIIKARITGITKVGKLILETEKRNILECDFKEVVFC